MLPDWLKPKPSRKRPLLIYCGKCGKVKAAREFYPSAVKTRLTTRWKNPYCKACNKEYAKLYARKRSKSAEFRQKHAEAQKRYRDRQRALRKPESDSTA